MTNEPVSLGEKKSLWEQLANTLQNAVDMPATYTTYDQLSPQHIPIFLLKLQGNTNTEIAEIIGMNRATIGQVLRSVAGQRLLSELYLERGQQLKDNNIMELIQSTVPEAIETTVEVMRTGRDDHRLKAALSLLDRAGYNTVHKVETTTKVVIERDRAELLQMALAESADVGDAEFEVVIEVEDAA